MSQTFDVAVIGGGAAGMMAAITAARKGAKVLLLEPNSRLGKKLNITGKGRCNVTNNCTVEELMASIPCNGKFLYSSFSAYNSQNTMAFFEEIGVPLKTERGNRVFPVSDRSFDVSGALERELRRLGVHWAKEKALELLSDETRVFGVRSERQEYLTKAVIVATGGVSYPLTGSTGDGYRFAESVGHTIVSPRGSLVPLEEDGETCAALQGLSLKNVSITVWENDKKKIYHDFGEMLFTHFGLSGPLILSASAHMRAFSKKSYRIEIDLKPALEETKLDQRILQDFQKYRNSDFCNALDDLLPKKLIPVIIDRSGIPARTKVHSVTKEQRRELIRCMKKFSVSIKGPRPVAEAIITSGGIKVGEVKPSTMASKLREGLFFAGEVLDTDAYTGGFNLQIAWSTGFVAGCHAANFAMEGNEER